MPLRHGGWRVDTADARYHIKIIISFDTIGDITPASLATDFSGHTIYITIIVIHQRTLPFYFSSLAEAYGICHA